MILQRSRGVDSPLQRFCCLYSVASGETLHLNQAVAQVRPAESSRLRAKSKKTAQQLKHVRGPLLRHGSRVRGRARQNLNALLASQLATARAWDLKETFSCFWKCRSEFSAVGFLDYWCFRAMRSRLEPMKQVARMLRAHEALILTWFRAKKESPMAPSRVSTTKSEW